MSDVREQGRPLRRSSVRWAVVASLGVVLAVAAFLVDSGRAVRPSVDDGYVVLQGQTADGSLGWLVGMVDDPRDLTIHGEHAYTVAGIHWRDVQNTWHHWNSSGDPVPTCLIPHRPVRAAIGYVQVAAVDDNPGFRQAVWLHCLSDTPAL